MTRQAAIGWLSKPEEHDYPAALSYLSLTFEARVAANYVKQLARAPVSQFKAKDIFRASGLPLLGISNSHIEKDRKKIKAQTALSPLLLVRDENSRMVVIADGYHRLCALYGYDEDAWVRCKIV